MIGEMAFLSIHFVSCSFHSIVSVCCGSSCWYGMVAVAAVIILDDENMHILPFSQSLYWFIVRWHRLCSVYCVPLYEIHFSVVFSFVLCSVSRRRILPSILILCFCVQKIVCSCAAFSNDFFIFSNIHSVRAPNEIKL